MKSSVLALTFLMVVVGSGCGHLRLPGNFPDIHPHVILPKSQRCGEYTVIRKSPFTVSDRPTKYKPLSQCTGYFAIPPEDAAAIRVWYDGERAAGRKIQMENEDGQ